MCLALLDVAGRAAISWEARRGGGRRRVAMTTVARRRWQAGVRHSAIEPRAEPVNTVRATRRGVLAWPPPPRRSSQPRRAHVLLSCWAGGSLSVSWLYSTCWEISTRAYDADSTIRARTTCFYFLTYTVLWYKKSILCFQWKFWVTLN